MIVMSIPEASKQFNNTEIGDYDGDGLPEFIDGWGHPIKFLRWPVGFYNALEGYSDLHPIDPSGATQPCDPDPFDPMGVAGGFAVFPLIYSAGPDGVYDINTGYDYHYSLDGSGNLNPYISDVNTNLVGQPVHLNDDGSPDGPPDSSNLYHYDNIHNHVLEVR